MRPPRPDHYGPALGRDGLPPSSLATGQTASCHGPGATINAAGQSHDAPANDHGRRIVGSDPLGVGIQDAINPAAASRIASDVLAIVQGVAS